MNKVYHREIPAETPKSLVFRETLDALKSETTRLRSQIQQDRRNIQGVGYESHIARLQDQCDAYTRKIETEKE